jgi:uncharacterized protein
VIDVHTHLHPPRLFAAIRRWFAERSPWVIEHLSEPAAVANALRAAGVERFVFCSYAHKPGMAAELNAWLAETSRALHGYGLPLATVHLDDEAPLSDLERALDDGCIGLKIHEDVQRIAIDDPRYAPLLALLEERGAFVLVHVGHVPWSEDTNGGPQRIAAVAARFPRLRIVVAHLGLPESRAYFALVPQHPNLFLDTTMAFAAPSPMHAGVGAADLAPVASAVLYGTDFPNIPYAYGCEREGLEGLGLPPGALRAILRENALRLAPVLGAGGLPSGGNSPHGAGV